MDFVLKFFLFYLPLLFSLCVHEFAHAWVAKNRGDLTAYYQGRLTLNPIAHVDMIGTILLPLILLFTNSSFFFGWAKPVPVQVSAFKNPKQDMFWVAFAGPLSNIFLACISAAILSFCYILSSMQLLPASKAWISMLEMLIYINMLLAVFNLIPLHPLDGAKVLARFLPAKWNIFLEANVQACSIVLLILMFSGALQYLSRPIIIFSQGLMSISRHISVLFLQVLL